MQKQIQLLQLSHYLATKLYAYEHFIKTTKSTKSDSKIHLMHIF